jgi:hypothetical protein
MRVSAHIRRSQSMLCMTDILVLSFKDAYHLTYLDGKFIVSRDVDASE